jgi:hypothetical protein
MTGLVPAIHADTPRLLGRGVMSTFRRPLLGLATKPPDPSRIRRRRAFF